LEIYCSARFVEHLDRYNGIEGHVARKIASLIRRYESDEANWHFELEKLKDDSFQGLNVFKIAITSGDRLIFSWKNQKLTLLALGKHEIMETYSKLSTEVIVSDLNRALIAPSWLLHQVTFYLGQISIESNSRQDVHSPLLEINSSESGQERWKYDAEIDKSWVTFLDEEQQKVSAELLAAIDNQTERMQVHFIFGGPGTGKTVVLFNLAQNISRNGRVVSFDLTDGVHKYLKSSGLTVPGAQLPITEGCVLLVDDPISAKDIAYQIRKAQTERCKCVVIGLDPLQWHDEGAAQNFLSLQEKYSITYHQLWTCYRQTKRVGENALNFTKKFFKGKPEITNINRKIAAQIELRNFINLSLAMEFVDEDGRFSLVEEVSNEKISGEVNRFKSRYDKWEHTAPIAFVFDDRLAPSSRKSIQELGRGIGKRDYRLQKSSDLRGLEFQEVFVFLSREFWVLAQTDMSKIKSEQWNELSHLHTVFSRPKDSLIIFILDEDFEAIS
jgi:hypothetical protein